MGNTTPDKEKARTLSQDHVVDSREEKRIVDHGEEDVDKEKTIATLPKKPEAMEQENTTLREKSGKVLTLREDRNMLHDENTCLRKKLRAMERVLKTKEAHITYLKERKAEAEKERSDTRCRMLRGQVMPTMRDECFREDLINGMIREDDKTKFRKRHTYYIVKEIVSNAEMMNWEALPFSITEIVIIYDGFRKVSKDRLDHAHPTKDLEDSEELSLVFEDTVEYVCQGMVSEEGKARLLEYKATVESCVEKENRKRSEEAGEEISLDLLSKQKAGSSSSQSCSPLAKRQRSDGVDIASRLAGSLSSPRAQQPSGDISSRSVKRKR